MKLLFVAAGPTARIQFSSRIPTDMSYKNLAHFGVLLDRVTIEGPWKPPPKPQPHILYRCNTFECCKRRCKENGYCCSENLAISKDGQLSCLQSCVLHIM